MKKLFLVMVIAVGLSFLPEVSKSSDLEIGIDELKSGVFYDFEDFYGGGLLPVMNYKKLVSGDIGFITKGQDTYISAGLSLNIQTGCELLKINYMLPAPVELGLSGAKNLNVPAEKLKIFLYAGITWNLGGSNE